MPNDFSAVKAECLADEQAFIAYLQSRGKWQKAREHGRGFLLCCPFHADKTPSAFFERNAGHPFIHCYGEKGGRCLSPNGKKAIDFLSAIAMLETGGDLKAAFKRMLEICGKKIDYPPEPQSEFSAAATGKNLTREESQALAQKFLESDAAFFELLTSGKLNEARVENPRSTENAECNPPPTEAPKGAETHCEAQQAPPLKRVGKSLDRTEPNAHAGASRFLTASAEMSQGEIYALTRSVLQRDNPTWTDAELNAAAVANAAIQYNALKHFGGAK